MQDCVWQDKNKELGHVRIEGDPATQAIRVLTMGSTEIVGEVGDINRFSNARKLVAFAGLDATVRASGQFVGTRNRMSKRGSPHLRRSIWLTAVSARRFNAQLRAYYESKRAEGKHSGVATGAVARRLVHIIHAVWRQQRPFEVDNRWTPPGGET